MQLTEVVNITAAAIPFKEHELGMAWSLSTQFTFISLGMATAAHGHRAEAHEPRTREREHPQRRG